MTCPLLLFSPSPSVPDSPWESSHRVFSLRRMAAEKKQLKDSAPMEKVAAALAKRARVEEDRTGEEVQFYDRNFITVTRAMHDFLLTTEDLKDLRVTSRRSPNGKDPPIKVDTSLGKKSCVF